MLATYTRVKCNILKATQPLYGETMSVQIALQFIQHLREDGQSHPQIANLPNGTLDAVVQLAAQVGYIFSEQDLRAAYQHDWAMRWLRYSRANANTQTAPADAV